MKIAEESPEAAFRSALAAGRFEIQRCSGCANHLFPPRVICPACGSGELIWHAAKGTGTVHSCTVVNRKPDQGGPYNVVLLDLDEGVRMMSHVVGFGDEEVPIGLTVRAQIEEGSHRLVFTAGEAS